MKTTGFSFNNFYKFSFIKMILEIHIQNKPLVMLINRERQIKSFVNKQ